MANAVADPSADPTADSGDSDAEQLRAVATGPDPVVARFAMALGAILAIRIASLMASTLGLHPDEAQYWAWSRSMDWGYFSKPPLVAWVIGATTALFGDAPWAVRLAAPLAHGGAAFALFALARRMYGDAAGVAAGLGWLLMPGIWLSSALISTDALLLPLWSLGLFAAWRWSEAQTMRWALLTGAAIGLGALAKYAMLYFPLCLALAAIWSPRVRTTVLSRQALAAAAVALAFIAPNIAWNATHNFETVAHTAANAHWGGKFLNLDELFNFLADQIAISGLLAGGLVWLLVALARGRDPLDDRAQFLLAFVAPPLAIIIVQALISRAHGNWAASAYPAAIVLIASRFAGGAFMRWSMRVHAVMFAAFLALATFPDVAYRMPVIGHGIENGLKRMAGWKETARRVAERAQAGNYSAVLVDHRHAYFELLYEWRNRKDLPPVRAWVLRDAPGNHAEATAPMAAQYDRQVLVVQMSPRYKRFLGSDFVQFSDQAPLEIATGPRKTRTLAIATASGFKPVKRDKSFVDAVGD